jgi:signal transduction histidine kinase
VRPPNENSNNTPDPFAADPSNDRSGFRESATLSLPAADNRVLFIAPGYPELARVFDTLLVNNFQPVHASQLSEVTLISHDFVHVFVDVSMPGALHWLQQLGDQQDEIFPIGLIEPGTREGSALAAGATGTLQLPLEPADVLLCVNRNRTRIERIRRAKELADRERQRIATASVEGVLATVCNELRNPLAAALANVEYLRDLDKAETFTSSNDDTHVIVEDTFDALQRVRGIIESLATLVKNEHFESTRVVFWQVAQSVLDDLGRCAAPVSLTGDPTVRGWADEDLLRQVLSTLVRRALTAAEASGSTPQVKLHVYSTDSEARISVRDNGPSLPADLLKSLLESSDAALRQSSSEMLLAVTHHAVVRMGGTLDYAQRRSPGSVFRIRLRATRSAD